MPGTTELIVPSLKALQFYRPKHRFTVNGKWVPSVSKVARQFTPPFDTEKWSAYVAKRDGKTVEQVLAEWEAKREASTQLGELVHAGIEKHLLGDHVGAALHCMMSPGCDSGDPLARFEAWAEHVGPRIAGPASVNGVPAIEGLVYHREFLYAGISDLLGETVKSGNLVVFDWKTNGTYAEDNKYGDTLLAPFEDLPSCEHTSYSIQTSLLRMAYESHGIEVAATAHVWIGEGGMLKLKAGMDLRERLADFFRTKGGVA